jgi:FkbM family methyltransferase
MATTTVRGIQSVTGWQSDFVVKHLHKSGAVRSKLPNGHTLRLRSRGDDWVSNQIYWRGWNCYEPETVPLFFRLAERAKVTFDVGAYVGYYTLLAAHANPSGRVFAFEPMPAIFERLKTHIKLNQLTNAEVFPSAAGENDGISDFFHIPGGLPTCSSLSLDYMHRAALADQVVSSRVSVIKLDRFVREKNIHFVDLMKIDTEGTEHDVLRGMIETLRLHHPNIVCEVLPDRGAEESIEEILRQLGYRFYHLTPEGPVPRDHVKGHPVWFNYLFSTLDAQSVATL